MYSVSIFFSFGSPLYIVFMPVYAYLLFETQLRMCVLNIEVFEKFLRVT